MGQRNKGRKLLDLNSATTDVAIHLNETWAKILILSGVKLFSVNHSKLSEDMMVRVNANDG